MWHVDATLPAGTQEEVSYLASVSFSKSVRAMVLKVIKSVADNKNTKPRPQDADVSNMRRCCRRDDATQLQQQFLSAWNAASAKKRKEMLHWFMEDITCETWYLEEQLS